MNGLVNEQNISSLPQVCFTDCVWSSIIEPIYLYYNVNIFQSAGFVIFLIYFTWDHNCTYLIVHDVLQHEMS